MYPIGTGLAWRAAWLVTEDAAASWFGWAAVSLSVPFLFQSFIAYPDGVGATLVMVGVLVVVGLTALYVARRRSARLAA